MNYLGLARHDSGVIEDKVPLVARVVIYVQTVYCQAAIRHSYPDEINPSNLCLHAGLYALNLCQIDG